MKRATFLVCVVLLSAGVVLPGTASAQSPFSVSPVAEGVYVVHFEMSGFSMNNLVVADADAVVLVDTLPTLPTLTPPFALYFPFSAVIQGVTGSRPVDTLVNTSWHFDHVGINGQFTNREGTARRFAHWRTSEYLAEPHCIEDLQPSPTGCMPAYPEAAWQPTIEVHGEGQLRLADETMTMHTLENAHSGADLFVRLERANIVYTGDVYFGGMYPIIDRTGGGTVNGTLAALRKIVARVDEDTIVVPSHGRVGNRQSLVAFIDMLESSRKQVRAMIARGFTEEQVMSDPSFAGLDAQWNSSFIDGPHFRKILYRDLASAR
jgi:glyoxylase-like metal-dependent hydrolase (beta-lactamase superfamily II)